MWVIAVAVVASIILAFAGRHFFSAKRRRHARYRQSAEKTYQALQAFAHDGQRINYLRKISPYAFEELILYALGKYGYKIVRNQSYSGDGGIDGRFYVDGELVLVQAKRYRGQINKQHVQEFERIVREHECHGIFCHTGRTGAGSRSEFRQSDVIELYSGEKLLDLLFPERRI
jgi:restriction system protein